MDLRDVLHHLIDGVRWQDEDGREAHEAIDRHFLRPGVNVEDEVLRLPSD